MTTLNDIKSQLYVDPNRRFEFIQAIAKTGIVADFDWHYGGHDLTQNCEALPGCIPKPFRLNASRHTVLFGPRASVTL